MGHDDCKNAYDETFYVLIYRSSHNADTLRIYLGSLSTPRCQGSLSKWHLQISANATA